MGFGLCQERQAPQLVEMKTGRRMVFVFHAFASRQFLSDNYKLSAPYPRDKLTLFTLLDIRNSLIVALTALFSMIIRLC